MTPEEQIIALSEWNGTPYHKPTEEELKRGSYYQYEPFYLNDLNAVHELEKKLSAQQLAEYRHELMATVIGREMPNPEWLNSGLPSSTLAIVTSAAQRCEALCRVLWPERWK